MSDNSSVESEESPVEEVSPEAPPADSDPEWASLLEYLLQERGFDFHGYKPASLARRIRKRMEAVRLQTFGAYQEYLRSHPGEFATLFNTILINVTSFFRDPAAWEAIRTRAIPEILSGKSPDEPIRAWSAGCASGEEAYTMAMLLAEAMGVEEFQRRVKIYATDIDDDALNAARHATYAARHVEDVPADLLPKYFDQADGIHIFRKDLRRQVIFGRHDLINDAPISRVDLLACRNTLMYLSAETQAQVLSRLHFALNEGGFLLLGRAETLVAHGHSFVTVDLKRRLFRKGARRTPRDQLLLTPERSINQDGSLASRFHQAALEASPVAQLVVDSAGELAVANERARDLFGLRKDDVGRPLRDLQISYRPVDLRSLIDRVESERRLLLVKDIEWRGRHGDLHWLDLSIAPVLDRPGVVWGTILSFNDATVHRQLERELERSHDELETAYQELQSTNEELETTNEELQSTVEELETTNEELQSTNEELETMNEELQSTNEELQNLNDELQQRGADLNMANAFLESVLSGLQSGVAVVDNELRILAWNRHAVELWGLRPEEVDGKHLFNLDIGLPLEQIRPMLRNCVDSDIESQELILDAVNRRGKTIRCRVTCSPLASGPDGGRGAILLMEDSPNGNA